MADLINRDILKASLRGSYDELMKIRNGLKYSEERQIADAQLNTFAEAIMRVKEQPTIDAVPVVRCKDCKHWKLIDEHIPHFECNIFCALHDHGYPTSADDFCSYGERKDDGA